MFHKQRDSYLFVTKSICKQYLFDHAGRYVVSIANNHELFCHNQPTQASHVCQIKGTVSRALKFKQMPYAACSLRQSVGHFAGVLVVTYTLQAAVDLSFNLMTF